MKDRLFHDDEFETHTDSLKTFAFNEQVAHVFDDMVRRSVPGYDLAQTMVCGFGRKILQSGDRVYDLGCSTATTLIQLAHTMKDATDITYEGIDASDAMIARGRDKIASHELGDRIHLTHADLLDFPFTTAKLISSLYTLQFLEPELRWQTLERIREALVPGGVFVLAEKIRFDDPIAASVLTEAYYAFKQANDYTKLEIQRKREALENVLRPATIQTNLDMLRSAGFSSTELVFSNLSFAIFTARP